ncbi:MAG: hypothetical protein ACTHK3_07585 [Solirubrobacterales bacterium]
MSTRDKAIALALALCAAVAPGSALSAPAGAASYGNGFEVARFKIEIKGYQNMTQHHTHEASGECDVSDHSFGRERVTFHTTKPIYITATHMPGEFNPQLFGGPQLGIPTAAKVERSFTPVIGLPTGSCGEFGGADPGSEEIKPDCGTKRIKPWRLELQYAREKKNALLLSGNGEQDPYVDCPGASTMGFPWLVVEGSGYKGKYIYADLSQDELFHPQFRKWISIADGSAKNVGSDYWTKTDVHWEVSFTRLKSKIPGA